MNKSKLRASDLSPGMTFTRLTLVKISGRNKYGSKLWLCKCECGNTKEVISSCLVSGMTQSCGCLQRDRATAANTKHGQTYTKAYWTWSHMHDRCRNPNNKYYPYYGGRGIKVCARWKSFDNFLADMGHPPSHAHSIDRLDPNRNYSPTNCRWANNKEQARTRTDNIWITEPDGSRLILKDWAAKYGISYKSLSARIKRHGITIAMDRARKRLAGKHVPRFITRGAGKDYYK